MACTTNGKNIGSFDYCCGDISTGILAQQAGIHVVNLKSLSNMKEEVFLNIGDELIISNAFNEFSTTTFTITNPDTSVFTDLDGSVDFYFTLDIVKDISKTLF